MASINSSMVFPPANFSNQGMTGLFSYAETVTGGLFGGGLIIAFYVVLLVALKAYPSNQANALASFFALIMTWMLVIAGIVPQIYITIASVFFALGIVWLVYEK